STAGGTNWYPPSYSPHTGLMYVSARESGGRSGKGDPGPWIEGQRYTGNGSDRGPDRMPRRDGGRAPVNNGFRTESEGYSAIRALDPKTGEKKWDFKMVDNTESGVLSTASDLVFGGGMEGNFVALDARTGELLWHVNLGGPNASGPISYSVNGRQYVIGTGAGTMYAFALPE
ncbi:MAG TPA: PQQ-binding-like beta-propeller repeat protein, partial [Bryobacteraceae bacterium]